MSDKSRIAGARYRYGAADRCLAVECDLLFASRLRIFAA
jgi:hypothetical protein